MKLLPRGLALILLSLAGAAALEGRVRIMATVLPLAEFAEAVAGDRGQVDLLLPPGAGVHDWQPRPGDIVRLAGCDLLLSVGARLEPWLPGLLRAAPAGRMRVLEASAGLDLTGDGHEHPGQEGGPADPHVWLDFELDVAIARAIAAELAGLDPEGAAVFAANADALAARLTALDARYREGLAACRGRIIVLAGHAAFGHLARRYGLEQRAVHGLSPDAEPRPKDLIGAVDLCRARGIRTVFREGAESPGLAKTLAREIGGRVLVLHAGHNLTREQRAGGLGFFDLMEENLATLRDGLECR